jgi:hypothetical protein
VVTCRFAAIDSCLQKDFFDVVLSEPSRERGSASLVLWLIAGRPDLAPDVARDQFLKFAIEMVAIL